MRRERGSWGAPYIFLSIVTDMECYTSTSYSDLLCKIVLGKYRGKKGREVISTFLFGFGDFPHESGRSFLLTWQIRRSLSKRELSDSLDTVKSNWAETGMEKNPTSSRRKMLWRRWHRWMHPRSRKRPRKERLLRWKSLARGHHQRSPHRRGGRTPAQQKKRNCLKHRFTQPDWNLPQNPNLAPKVHRKLN